MKLSVNLANMDEVRAAIPLAKTELDKALAQQRKARAECEHLERILRRLQRLVV